MNDLTAEEMLKVAELLKAANNACPACSSGLVLQKRPVRVQMTCGRNADYAVMACKACGYVRHHSMHILGLYG